VRLSPSDIAALPFICALFSGNGTELGRSPEWRGFSLGAVTYQAGIGTLVVVADGGRPEVDALVVDLVAEIAEASATLQHRDRLAIQMLVTALALVAGRAPVGEASGSVEDVIEYAREGIRRSVPGIEVRSELRVTASVPCPPAVALGLVQLARNAALHSGAREVTLTVTRGPTFRVEWRAAGADGRVSTSRRPDQRPRWGLGFVRLLADALGGNVTAPAPIAPGIVASSIGLGSPRFSAPIAAVRDGRVERATRAWDEETGLPPGTEVDQRVGIAVQAALADPGHICYSDILRARCHGALVWVAVAPQSSLGRARDVLRGIQHENTLMTAPEPHATRIYAISTILASIVDGEPAPPVSLHIWTRDFPAACAALGIPSAHALDSDRLRYPDPRVAAFLVATLGGELLEGAAESGSTARTAAVLAPQRGPQSSPLLALLGRPDGLVPLGA
jgi:hypothetical protein